MALADLHLHTTHSDGLTSPEDLIERIAAMEKFKVIAVTDHDLVGGAVRARDYAKKRGLPLQVIVGTEVSTRHGHIVGLFIEKRIPKFMSAEKTIEAIHAQGGLAIAAHPLNFLTASLSRKKMIQLAKNAAKGNYFDAIETASSYPFFEKIQPRVLELNQELKLPELGASDAHFPWEQGSSYTEFEGDNIDDLKEAIRRGKTKAYHVSVPLKKYLSWKVPYQMFRSWTWRSPFWPSNRI